MPVEQVMERVADETARVPGGPAGVAPEAQPAAQHQSDGAHSTFSPDPQQRTDRYRLVTPYLLRL
jgi:hypothetical protein